MRRLYAPILLGLFTLAFSGGGVWAHAEGGVAHTTAQIDSGHGVYGSVPSSHHGIVAASPSAAPVSGGEGGGPDSSVRSGGLHRAPRGAPLDPAAVAAFLSGPDDGVSPSTPPALLDFRSNPSNAPPRMS